MAEQLHHPLDTWVKPQTLFNGKSNLSCVSQLVSDAQTTAIPLSLVPFPIDLCGWPFRLLPWMRTKGETGARFLAPICMPSSAHDGMTAMTPPQPSGPRQGWVRCGIWCQISVMWLLKMSPVAQASSVSPNFMLFITPLREVCIIFYRNLSLSATIWAFQPILYSFVAP